MSFDPTLVRKATRHLRRTDPVMADVIRRVGPFTMKPERRRFVALARAIIGQQISGSAARSIWRRLHNTVNTRTITAASILDLSTDEFRSAGVSPQKISYLGDLAAKVTDGTVRFRRLNQLSDEDVIAELTQVKGIGVWTAQMFLMFSLCRPDVFAPGDLGLCTALRNQYGLAELPNNAACETLTHSWRPYRTIGSWYLWRSTEPDANLT